MFHHRYFSILAVGVGTCLHRQHSWSENYDEECAVHYEPHQTLSNWSSTHSVNIGKVYEPRNVRELDRLLKFYQSKKQKIRPTGTALSPNGISFPDQNGNAISLHHFNSIVVDPQKNTVRVGAGATVAEVLKELSKYHLTLENFSSIQEQQIAGWTQVAAHGTGCKLSTVEEQIIEMKLVTPSSGLLTLSNEHLPDCFNMAKVGLGSLGVITELTMKCIPQLSLREETAAFDRNTINQSHYNRLRNYRHVRYMWIPYTPTVVSVVSNPTTSHTPTTTSHATSQSTPLTPSSSQLPTQALMNIVKQSQKSQQATITDEFLKQQGFGTMRDLALGVDPLNLDHVIKVNKAEAEYWKNAQGVRVDDSTNILGFDCGGEQWVLEVCFPMKTLQDETYDDIHFVRELLKVIETQRIPAPGPIEQRWTSRSTAPMSPAFSKDPNEIFCWVGIIMYMPLSQSPSQREDIRRSFQAYCQAIQPLMKKYNAQIHWAKIELPDENGARLEELRQQIYRKYPVNEFQSLRKTLDPEGILSNSMVEKLLN